jgi:selenocysteine lyase/cysteine desulfurase
MTNRKDFLKQSLCLGFFSAWLAKGFSNSNLAHIQEANEEAFWQHIRQQFSLSSKIINLNNGGVSPQPYSVQEAHVKNYRFSNLGPTYYMWRELDEQREPLRRRLANFCGVDAEEVAFNRNATEGLNTIIFGLPLKAGDEVVLSKFDYPNMLNAWKQRALREGIKLNWVELNLPEEDENILAEKYLSQITPKTKIVHITHMMNWTGQVTPVRKIADVAHQKGCEVIVDGAHSFAHLDFQISDLHCDYFAASCHKWLCAPFGTGFMFIKREKIGKVWPLLSSPDPNSENIRKFESLGTRSFAAEMAVNAALDFHLFIGNKRKENRLRTLKNYWAEKLLNIPSIKLLTSLKDNVSCGIGTFEVKGKTADEIANYLMEKAKLHTSTVKIEGLQGVRISPHIYTTFEELDVLVQVLCTLK